MHGTTHVQHQQRGVACQEANGPGGTGRGIGWGLKGRDVQTLAEGERQAPPLVAEALGRAEQTLVPAPAVMHRLSAALQGQGFQHRLRVADVVSSGECQSYSRIADTSAFCCSAQARWFCP